ncbi:MAG: hypothetical protein HDR01_13005 [Lachnospiraceae bacterium]|nr:hypothetical protein [Lachnospiraceae bacterium]
MKSIWVSLYTIFIFVSATISTLIIMVWQTKDMEMAGKSKAIFLILLFASTGLTMYAITIGLVKMIKSYENDKKIKWIIGVSYCLVILLIFFVTLFHLISVTKLSLKDDITTNYQVFYRFLCYFSIAQLIHAQYFKVIYHTSSHS